MVLPSVLGLGRSFPVHYYSHCGVVYITLCAPIMSYIMTVCDVHMFVHVFNNNIILFTIIYLLTKRFISRLLSSSVVGNTVCGCGRYKVNGVTGGDEVGDETGDDVW